jgi:2'-5' RNA ligase
LELEIYEQLWQEAVAALERGEPRVDPYLTDKAKDLRRGVTLVIRPSAGVQKAVAEYIGRLAEVCPGQHFYRPEELHVTVLSIISGTELWRREIGRVAACQRVLGDVLKNQRPFKIKFQGITAARDSVAVQGFPLSDGLLTIRNAIREAFAQNGLGDMLDRRYKVTGAHMTIMRFQKPCSDSERLLAFLKETREIDFGECEVKSLELNWADWYASAETTRVLEEYHFG